MRTRAPGKVVLSGAYAVLRGAPAIVTAVGRYAEADAARATDFVTPEVAEALRELAAAGAGTRGAPWFDASALRDKGAKLGLGSSAAIVVASLGALLPPEAGQDERAWRRRIYALARPAHRTAQGGGSGIDVAAAVFGGTLVARMKQPVSSDQRSTEFRVEPTSLPPGLHLELWVALGQPAKTSHFVAAVLSLEQRRPAAFEALFGPQKAAALETAAALESGKTLDFIEGLRAQLFALGPLGEAAGVPIVAAPLRRLEEHARPSGVFLPAGAGGGDVALYAGTTPSNREFRAAAGQHGLRILHAECGVRGLHAVHSG